MEQNRTKEEFFGLYIADVLNNRSDYHYRECKDLEDLVYEAAYAYGILPRPVESTVSAEGFNVYSELYRDEGAVE